MMWPKIFRIWKEQAGVAMVEFALTAPLLIFMYLGGYVLCDAIGCDRKISRAARTVADLTSRYAAMSASDIDTVLKSSATIMSPYSSRDITTTISEVQVTDSTHAKVIWSFSRYHDASAAGRPVNSIVTLPSNMVHQALQPDPRANPPKPGAYLILGEVGYDFSPLFPVVITQTINLHDEIYMIPRLADQVLLQ